MMTESDDGPVASGRPHLIIEVADREPLSLEDFVGETTFIVVDDIRVARIEGSGILSTDGVMFNQRDGRGRDLREWHITGSLDDQFEAAPVGKY